MSRVQLAINVDDLESSIDFYRRLFGAEPAKVRPGYANFAVAEPPLKLVLIENPGEGGSVNHLGVEVADTDTVDAEQTRLAEAGFASVDERDTTGAGDAFDGAFLLTRYRSEFDMTAIPLPVRRSIFPIQAFLGRILGRYSHFSDAPAPIHRPKSATLPGRTTSARSSAG